MHAAGSTSVTVSDGDTAARTRPSAGLPHDRRVELQGDDGTASWSMWFSQRDLVTAEVGDDDLARLDLEQTRFVILRLWDERAGQRRAYSWTTRQEDPSVNRNSRKGDVRVTAYDATLDEAPAGFAGRPAGIPAGAAWCLQHR